MYLKRIYIAGPMRGIEKHNCAEFRRVAGIFASDPYLRAAWNAVSPVDLSWSFGSNADDLDANPALLDQLMTIELAVVKSCDAILLLRGWEKSEGARAELRVAIDNKLEIYTQESGVLVR